MIDERRAYTYFKNRFALRKSTNGFFVFDCPFCIDGESKKKHAVSFSWGVTKCWVCGWKKHITDFVMEYEGVRYMQAKDLIQAEIASNVEFEASSLGIERQLSTIELPVGFNSILSGSGVLGERARKYLFSRGFDLEELDSLGFGYCNEKAEEKADDYFGYIIVPFKKRGKLVYYIGRDYTGNYLRYKNPSKEKMGVGKGQLWFNEDALELSKTVFLAEGWADAMTMGKAGSSSQGWSLSREQRINLHNSDASKLVFMPDIGLSDDNLTFHQKAVQLALEFIDTKQCVVLDFVKAGMDKFGKDVNEFGKKRVFELYRDTEPLTERAAMEILMS
jgi:DNA primase